MVGEDMKWSNLAYSLLHEQPSAGEQHLHLAEDPFLKGRARSSYLKIALGKSHMVLPG